MHPHEPADVRFTIQDFLTKNDFIYFNPRTRRDNTLDFKSVKTQSLAAARKTLTMGSVAVFATNKRGQQGAIGLAEELLAQLSTPLSLPNPIQYANQNILPDILEYFTLEYGTNWVGTRAIRHGFVLHHGDIPQETREVVENLIRAEDVKFAICTKTLAEGVNLPIRTLVIYSVQRRDSQGQASPMLSRDIKNLVGRVGRAGLNTKGLVICANHNQWHLVEPSARLVAGEPVLGALHALIIKLKSQLAVSEEYLTNDFLENSPNLHTLVDGIDATLIDLASEEMDLEQVAFYALRVAEETLASRRADEESKELLQKVFSLRAVRVTDFLGNNRLNWIKESGVRLRMVDSVERHLLPLCELRDALDYPLDTELINAMLFWAWHEPGFNQSVGQAFGLQSDQDAETVQLSFFRIVFLWLYGSSFAEIADEVKLDVNIVLDVFTSVISYKLQSLVEQACALLPKLSDQLSSESRETILELPEYLRFGVPSVAAKVLSGGGIRHRRAAVALGISGNLVNLRNQDTQVVFNLSQNEITENENAYRNILGNLVYENTRRDMAEVIQLFDH